MPPSCTMSGSAALSAESETGAPPKTATHALPSAICASRNVAARLRCSGESAAPSASTSPPANHRACRVRPVSALDIRSCQPQGQMGSRGRRDSVRTAIRPPGAWRPLGPVPTRLAPGGPVQAARSIQSPGDHSRPRKREPIRRRTREPEPEPCRLSRARPRLPTRRPERLQLGHRGQGLSCARLLEGTWSCRDAKEETHRTTTHQWVTVDGRSSGSGRLPNDKLSHPA